MKGDMPRRKTFSEILDDRKKALEYAFDVDEDDIISMLKYYFLTSR